ncbi:hypothetical protein ABIA31_009419, partial [Catenulispora sp. MAP5-51]
MPANAGSVLGLLSKMSSESSSADEGAAQREEGLVDVVAD